MSETLLTVEEFAIRTHQHKETVRRQLRAGKIPTIRTGKKYLIPESVATQAKPTPLVPTLLIPTAIVSSTNPDSDLGNSSKIGRRAAMEKGFGFLQGQIASSDDFLAQRHNEAQREMRKDKDDKNAGQEQQEGAA